MNEEEYISTGNYLLDQYLEIGVLRGELGIVPAPPVHGRSNVSAIKLALMSTYGVLGDQHPMDCDFASLYAHNPCSEIIMDWDETSDLITRRGQEIHEQMENVLLGDGVEVRRDNTDDFVTAFSIALMTNVRVKTFDTGQGISFKKPKKFKLK